MWRPDEETVLLFPFSDFWWFYLAFTGLILVFLAIDLGVFHRTPRPVSMREATVWTIVWIALALVFNYLLYLYSHWTFANDPRLNAIAGFDAHGAARQVGLEFLAGYIIERALSIDNLFVFVVVFGYFGISPRYQHRVLFYGILGAMIFRAIFIAMGALLIRYYFVIIFFGLFLIFTGIKLIVVSEKTIEPEKNLVLRLLRRHLPVTPELRGQRFFVRHKHRIHATPLMIALLFLEMTDIVFAVDSVPAIFAVTREPMIVYTSNIFAILGLRAMYFLLAGMVEKFHLLKYGLGIVLIFVGLKMAWLNDLFGGKFPTGVSLIIISVVIGASIGLSLLFPGRGTEPPGAEEDGDGGDRGGLRAEDLRAE